MRANFYDISDPVLLSATLTLNSTGDGFDPTSVVLKVKDYRAVITTYEYGVNAELERSAAGQYSLIYTPTMTGLFFYRWEIDDATDSTRHGAQEGMFRVRYSFLTNGSGSSGGDGSLDGGSP